MRQKQPSRSIHITQNFTFYSLHHCKVILFIIRTNKQQKKTQKHFSKSSNKVQGLYFRLNFYNADRTIFLLLLNQILKRTSKSEKNFGVRFSTFLCLYSLATSFSPSFTSNKNQKALLLTTQ